MEFFEFWPKRQSQQLVFFTVRQTGVLHTYCLGFFANVNPLHNFYVFVNPSPLKGSDLVKCTRR